MLSYQSPFLPASCSTVVSNCPLYWQKNAFMWERHDLWCNIGTENKRSKIRWFSWWWNRKRSIWYIDLPLIITMILDLLALKVRSAQFRAIADWESKVFAPQIVEDIMVRSSMKTLIGGNEILFWLNCCVVATKESSGIVFIPAKKKNYRKGNHQKFRCDAYANCWVPPERKTSWISQSSTLRLSGSILGRHHTDGVQR